jgi:hypothetical protein
MSATEEGPLSHEPRRGAPPLRRRIPVPARADLPAPDAHDRLLGRGLLPARSPHLPAGVHVEAGEDWYFQLLFRDPPAGARASTRATPCASRSVPSGLGP